MKSSEFKLAFKLSLPTLVTYTVFGIIFAVLWVKSGFPEFWAPVMSILAFAGVAQMIALSMMQADANILAIFVAVLFVTSRNIFYGLSFIDRYKNKPRLMRYFLIFGLIDATYGILVANPASTTADDTKFCFYVTLLPFLYWVFGTCLGVLLFKYVQNVPNMEFVLCCFFTILVIDYYSVHRDKLCIIMPIIFATLSYIIIPTYFLLTAIILSAIFIYNFYNPKFDRCNRPAEKSSL